MHGSSFIRGGLAGLLSVTIFLAGCGGGSGGGDSSFSSARGVAVDGGGNVFIAGDTNATLGPGSMGDSDMFVIKNDPGSGTQWIQQFGTALFDMASAVAVDNAGNVYMAGYTQYDPWSPTGMGGCLLLVKYDSAGNRM